MWRLGEAWRPRRKEDRAVGSGTSTGWSETQQTTPAFDPDHLCLEWKPSGQSYVNTNWGKCAGVAHVCSHRVVVALEVWRCLGGGLLGQGFVEHAVAVGGSARLAVHMFRGGDWSGVSWLAVDARGNCS